MRTSYLGGISLSIAMLGAGCGAGDAQDDPAMVDDTSPVLEVVAPPKSQGGGLVRGTAFLRFGRDRIPQQVPYVVHGEWAVAQGDILLGRVDEVMAESVRLKGEIAQAVAPGDEPASAIGKQDSSDLWDGAIVPFALDDSLTSTQRTEIRAAMDHWERRTVARFQETSGACDLFQNCVTFVRNTDGECNSLVGKQKILGVPARQTINVADWCMRGNLIHEIGHAMGLWHEHTRSDRDSFISVQWGNFSTDPDLDYCPDQFARETDSSKNIGPYDFGSIMHYGQTSGCSGTDANGNPLSLFTLVQPVPPGVTVGQRNGLSDGDLSAITTMYGSWVSRKYAEYGLISRVTYVGLPTEAEGRAKDWGRYRHYQFASIYWHPDTGAHLVHEEIRSKWEALGWEWSSLGYPISDTEETALGQKVNHFEHGSIYWREDTGHQVIVSDPNGGSYELVSGIKGHVDDILPATGVRGWAYDVHSPASSIGIHFYVDGPAGSGAPWFAGTTSVSRPDVNATFGITGTHGFMLPVPEQYYDGQPHTVYVYGLDAQYVSNPAIDGIPYTFTFAGAEGDVNSIASDGTVSGWALDLNSKSVSIAVHYYINGPAGGGGVGFATTTNVYRGDVNSTYGATGNHGFAFTIPTQYQDGYTHSLYVYAIDAQGRHNPLLGGPRYFAIGTPPDPEPDPDPDPTLCEKKPWLCE